ncbi:MAG: glycosyltransferase [Chloroflexia bacterium]
MLAFLIIVSINLAVLPTTTSYRPDTADQPSVAVLIPARNEAENIEACLRSLLQQNYPNLTIWLYDDDSTDDTLAIARRISNSALRTQNSALRIVEGKEGPPAGWLGKANALYRLYGVVKAESDPAYLLFTDADVQFEIDAVACAVATAQSWKAGLLSMFPRQRLGSFAERLAVPTLLHWTVYNFLPLSIAFSERSGSSFAAANGQFMLFTREAYEACGTHEAVKSQILEDVALSRAVKQAGYKAILADGGATVSTRMYRGAGEVWRGYSKNAYAFFNYKPYFLAVGVLVLLALYVLPLGLAVIAFLGGDALTGSLFVAHYLVAVVTRLLLGVRFAYPLADAFLHPLAVGYMIAIQINSMVWSITKRGAWKGRVTS